MKLDLKSILLGKSNLALLAGSDGVLIAPKEDVARLAKGTKAIPYGLVEYNLDPEDSERAAREFLADIISGKLVPLMKDYSIYVPLEWEIITEGDTNERQ